MRNTFQPIPIAMGQPGREALVGEQRSAEEMEQGTDSTEVSISGSCILWHRYFPEDDVAFI